MTRSFCALVIISYRDERRWCVRGHLRESGSPRSLDANLKAWRRDSQQVEFKRLHRIEMAISGCTLWPGTV